MNSVGTVVSHHSPDVIYRMHPHTNVSDALIFELTVLGENSADHLAHYTRNRIRSFIIRIRVRIDCKFTAIDRQLKVLGKCQREPKMVRRTESLAIL